MLQQENDILEDNIDNSNLANNGNGIILGDIEDLTDPGTMDRKVREPKIKKIK